MFRIVVPLLLMGLVTGTFCGLVRAEPPIMFEDVTERTGLKQHLQRWRLGHAGAWGDVDGDGRPDLYVGAFADRYTFNLPDAPLPNMLFLNTDAGFVLSRQETVEMKGKTARTSGALFVDLDNDGDLDLVCANHASGPLRYHSVLLENIGNGKFRDVTPTDGDWPHVLGARNISALDFDGDGSLELIIIDGAYKNWKTGAGRLIVLKKVGRWKFKEIGGRIGFPPDGTFGAGLAVGDVNDDGVFDFFVTDCNRLFISSPDGKYREHEPGLFALPKRRGDRECHSVGAGFGDLNGNGLVDLVITEHVPGPCLHVWINQGIRKDGTPMFRKVSDDIGLRDRLPSEGPTGLPIKSAHVAIRDVDNDGRNDIMLSMVYKPEGGPVQPFVLRNLTDNDSPLRFDVPKFESIIGYYAPGPVADYDRDGRVDIFLPSWFDELPNYLFRNVCEGGNRLTVRVVGDGKRYNTMGVGATVRVYRRGYPGDKTHLLGRFDIAIGTGYASGEQALAHVGLGENQQCDVVVTWGQREVVRGNVASNQTITVDFSP